MTAMAAFDYVPPPHFAIVARFISPVLPALRFNSVDGLASLYVPNLCAYLMRQCKVMSSKHDPSSVDIAVILARLKHDTIIIIRRLSNESCVRTSS